MTKTQIAFELCGVLFIAVIWLAAWVELPTGMLQ
jgi:hypothetical protein